MVLTILVVGEETKLLLPGSKIITGRMHAQHHKLTNFPPCCYQLIGKSVFSLLYKDSDLYILLTSERAHELPANHKTDIGIIYR